MWCFMWLTWTARKGLVNLTGLPGILIGKGAALRILVDPHRDRHMTTQCFEAHHFPI